MIAQIFSNNNNNFKLGNHVHWGGILLTHKLQHEVTGGL